jgi:hypothetical protein
LREFWLAKINSYRSLFLSSNEPLSVAQLPLGWIRLCGISTGPLVIF